MGKVAAVYNMVPESPEVNPEEIVKALPAVLPDGVGINSVSIKPFAFGS